MLWTGTWTCCCPPLPTAPRWDHCTSAGLVELTGACPVVVCHAGRAVRALIVCCLCLLVSFAPVTPAACFSYVPVLRIGLIQLELLTDCVLREYAEARQKVRGGVQSVSRVGRLGGQRVSHGSTDGRRSWSGREVSWCLLVMTWQLGPWSAHKSMHGRVLALAKERRRVQSLLVEVGATAAAAPLLTH